MAGMCLRNKDSTRTGKRKEKKLTKAQKKAATKKSRAAYFKKRRQDLKADPVRYAAAKDKDRERWRKRVAEGKVKTLSDMTPREKRSHRQRRRLVAKSYYDKKKTVVEKAPQPEKDEDGESKQKKQGKKAIRNRRIADKIKIKRLESQLKEAEQRAEKYRKRAQRFQESRKGHRSTPRTAVRKILRGIPVNAGVRKKLLFGEIVTQQLENSSGRLSRDKDRQVFGRLLGTTLLKKYRVLKKSRGFISKRMVKWCSVPVKSNLEFFREKSARAKSTLKVVQDFYKDDSNSVLSPGKKEFCYIGQKEKVRYMTDSQIGLYVKFCSTIPIKLSYSQFCKLRPHFVKEPCVSARDTCACQKCENYKLLVLGAHRADLISEKNKRELVNGLCCTNKTDQCLSRNCKDCHEKIICYNEINADSILSFYQWKREKKSVPKKNSNCDRGNALRDVTITLKVLVEKTVSEVVDLLEESTKEYMQHAYRISHQYKAMKNVKDGVGEDELVLHVDFSEGYPCKYATETQGVHFGASRDTISLHTGVAYTSGSKQSFCTVSDSMRHDPASIMAHITPILESQLKDRPLVNTLHMISDGPTSQYRSKDYFYLLTTLLPECFPQLIKITHNYSEAGHGKGAPDGIGGLLKAMADDAEAHGADVQNFEAFVEVIEKNVKTVLIRKVDEKSITDIDKVVVKGLKPFVGTMKVHQLKWSHQKPREIYFNSLSCFSCEVGKACSHFNMGLWKMPKKK